MKIYVAIILSFSLLIICCSRKPVKNDNFLRSIDDIKRQQNYPKHGCISGDCENGKGIFHYSPHHSEVEGEWKNGELVGQCTIIFENGNKYIGNVKKNPFYQKGNIVPYIFNGYGVLEEGVYQDILKEKDFDKSIKFLLSGEKERIGKRILEGNWKDGIIDGTVIIYLNDDGIFKGNIGNGKIYGTWTYPDGRKYVGQVKGHHYHGKGVLTLADGSKYSGQFKDGEVDGYTTWTTPAGETYTGMWKMGRPNGQGTYKTPFGRKYVGEFTNGLRHGWGTQYDKHGKIEFQGRWYNDVFIGH